MNEVSDAFKSWNMTGTLHYNTFNILIQLNITVRCYVQSSGEKLWGESPKLNKMWYKWEQSVNLMCNFVFVWRRWHIEVLRRFDEKLKALIRHHNIWMTHIRVKVPHLLKKHRRTCIACGIAIHCVWIVKELSVILQKSVFHRNFYSFPRLMLNTRHKKDLSSLFTVICMTQTTKIGNFCSDATISL